MEPIAHIRSDFATKFAIPRQSGLVPELVAKVVFEPPYRNQAALRGITGFSHLWLIWDFSQAHSSGFSPTVRPPRLGGNQRMGVFATRSPFRPNSIGLSAVRLIGLEDDASLGAILLVGGADLADRTPIWDIKPYIAADCHPEASFGFTADQDADCLSVIIPDELAGLMPAGKLTALYGVLAQDPRPAYHNDPERIYGFDFAGFKIKFQVSDGILRVVQIVSD